MENRRVVVTGLGAVTPLGNTVGETWEGLKSGRHGIGPITGFDTSAMKATLAAEVKDFRPEDYTASLVKPEGESMERSSAAFSQAKSA